MNETRSTLALIRGETAYESRAMAFPYHLGEVAGSKPIKGTNSKDNNETLPAATQVERALEVAATVGNLVPVLGGVVASVLSGLAGDRRFERVREVLLELADRVKGVSAEQEKYIRGEDFEDLLIETLQRVWRERDEEKRRIYRDFLAAAIASPGGPYDEQLRFLRTLEELQGDHIRILRAIFQEPSPETSSLTGSPIRTLQRRLPDMDEARIDDLVTQLNDLRITNLGSLRVMMTARGAEDLRPTMTPYGQRFVRFLRTSDT